MKKLGFILGALLISFTGIAQEKKGATITVTIENVRSDNGTILAGLHTTDTFMKAEALVNTGTPAKIGEVTLTFKNVQPGTFAIMVIHDANDNKQIDMDPSTGIPQESYGTSGKINPYGPPAFTDAKFEVTDKDQTLTIRF